MNAEYKGQDRRATERRDEGRSLADVQVAFSKELAEHEKRESDRVNALIEAVKTEAFPDGAEAHRLAHQAMIDAAKQEAEFWRGLKVEIAKKSIWGILHILTILVIAGIAAKFGLGSIVAAAVTGK